MCITEHAPNELRQRSSALSNVCVLLQQYLKIIPQISIFRFTIFINSESYDVLIFLPRQLQSVLPFPFPFAGKSIFFVIVCTCSTPARQHDVSSFCDQYMEYHHHHRHHKWFTKCIAKQKMLPITSHHHHDRKDIQTGSKTRYCCFR